MRCLAATAALLLLLSAPWAASAAGADGPLLDPATAAALQDRDYPAALKAIAAAAAVKGAPQAELAYLKAWTLCLNKDYDAAAAACDELVKQYAGSPLAARALFVKGQALARKGDYLALRQPSTAARPSGRRSLRGSSSWPTSTLNSPRPPIIRHRAA